MNKFFILLLSACCLLTTACDKENDETVQGFRIMKADVGCGLVQGNRSDKRKDNFACQSQL